MSAVQIDQRVIVPADSVTGPANTGTPTQVANPTRTGRRTFVQSLIAFLVTANAAAVALQGFLVTDSGVAAALLGEHFGVVLIVVNGVVLVGSFVSRGIAALMADPKVNGWVTRHLPWLAPIRTVEHRPIDSGN